MGARGGVQAAQKATYNSRRLTEYLKAEGLLAGLQQQLAGVRARPGAASPGRPRCNCGFGIGP